MAKKVSRSYEERDVFYSDSHWKYLSELRRSAMEVMASLEAKEVETIVHGSVARGDVSSGSDVDVFILEVIPSYSIESALATGGFDITRKELTQATPVNVVKAIIYVGDKLKVSFPLVPLRGRERDFYRFGGEIKLADMKAERRVPGVDKRLMMIIPSGFGHHEYSIIGESEEAAKVLGVSLELVKERTRVLLRRDDIGRTGVYYIDRLDDDETFEGKLQERLSNDPSLRRLFQRRGLEFKY